MRRVATTSLVIALVVGLAAPASAATRRETSRSLNVFWHSTRRVSEDVTRRVTWYVGVYESSSEGTWSDLYQSVSRCRVGDGGRRRCRTVSFRYGESDLSDAVFTMEDGDLSAAHLDATYMLETRDGDGDRTGRPVATRIVTDLTGSGEVREWRSRYEQRRECRRIRYDSRGLNRRAVATGTVGGHDLGSTRRASLGTSTTTIKRTRTC